MYLTNKIKKYIPIIIVIITSFVSFYWMRDSDLISLDDSYFPVEKTYEAMRFVSSWDSWSLGNANYRVLSLSIPYGLYLCVTEKLNISNHVSQSLSLYITLLASGLSMYYLVITVMNGSRNKQYFALLSSIFYMFNPWVAVNGGYFLPYISFTPLLIALYIKLLNSHKISLSNTLLISLIWWFTSSSAVINIRGLVLQLIFIFTYLIHYIFNNPSKTRVVIKYTFLMCVVYFFINSYWSLLMLTNFKEIIDKTAVVYENIDFDWMSAFKHNSARASGIIRFIGSWAFKEKYRGSFYNIWAQGYFDAPYILLGVFLSCIPIISLSFSGHMKSDTHNNGKYFLFLFVFGFSIMLGSNFFLTSFWSEAVPYFSVIFSLPYFYGGLFFIVAYSVLIGYSSKLLLMRVGSLSRKFLYILILLLMLLYSYPVITGRFIRSGDHVLGSQKLTIPNYVYDFTEDMNSEKMDYRIFPFPYSTLTYCSYKWGDAGFSGVDPVINMVNKSIVYGFEPLNLIPRTFDKNINFTDLERLLGMMNVKYILVKKDVNNIYIDNHPWYTTPDKYFYESYEKDNSQIKSYGNFDLIEINSSNFLSRFYIPLRTVSTSKDGQNVAQTILKDNDSRRLSVYLNSDKDEVKNYTHNPVVEYRKINPTKYRVVVHNVKEEFPLIFSENFHDEWKIYLVEYEKNNINLDDSDYKILDYNEEYQANIDELKYYIANDYISSLGDLKERVINHNKWVSNKKTYDYSENYKIDFISKNVQGTIQNNNLSRGKFYETWLLEPIEDGKNHKLANGYSNSWLIDPEKICTDNNWCYKSDDGSFTMEFVVDFSPQRVYYIGVMISLITIAFSVTYILFAHKIKCERSTR